jgi:hypothetical protein
MWERTKMMSNTSTPSYFSGEDSLATNKAGSSPGASGIRTLSEGHQPAAA